MLELQKRKTGRMMVAGDVGLRKDGTISFRSSSSRCRYKDSDINTFTNLCSIAAWQDSIVGLKLDGEVGILTEKDTGDAAEDLVSHIRMLNRCCRYVQLVICNNELWALGEDSCVYILSILEKDENEPLEYLIRKSRYHSIAKIAETALLATDVSGGGKAATLLDKNGKVLLSKNFFSSVYIQNAEAEAFARQAQELENIVDLATGNELGPVLFAIDSNRAFFRIGGGPGSDRFAGQYRGLLVDEVWAGGGTHVCRLTDGRLLAGGRSYDPIIDKPDLPYVYCRNRYEHYLVVAEDGSILEGSALSGVEKTAWNLGA